MSDAMIFVRGVVNCTQFTNQQEVLTSSINIFTLMMHTFLLEQQIKHYFYFQVGTQLKPLIFSFQADESKKKLGKVCRYCKNLQEGKYVNLHFLRSDQWFAVSKVLKTFSYLLHYGQLTKDQNLLLVTIQEQKHETRDFFCTSISCLNN